jgi:hypothetical protein
MKLARWLLVPAVCLPLLATSTDAAMRRISLGRLVAGAERIVEATVVETSSRVSPELGVIVTDVRLDVRDAIAGAADATLVVTLLGGTLGNETHSFSNEPTVEVGERAVFFLETMPWGLAVSGRFQGVYRIEDDVVVHPVSGARAPLATFAPLVREMASRNR